MSAMRVSSQGEEKINPYDPQHMASLKHWGEPPGVPQGGEMQQEVVVDCGWGRLVFGQTYNDSAKLAKVIRQEKPGRRDIAMYMRDPHVVLSYAPQELFLDPSLTYRLDFNNYRGGDHDVPGVIIRRLKKDDDQMTINRIYKAWGMVPCHDGFYEKAIEDPRLCVLVAEDASSGRIVGVITGVDHFETFQDPDNGSSLWALAVDQ